MVLVLKYFFNKKVRTVSTTTYTRVYKKSAVIPKKVEENPKSVDKIKTEASPSAPVPITEVDTQEQDWSTSFYGLSSARFPDKVAEVLLEPIKPEDIEIKPGNFKEYNFFFCLFT